MSGFVPDFDPEEYDDYFATITTSSAPLHNSNIPKISQSQDEDASLLELLWNKGPVVRPLESGQFRETPERREPGGGGCGDVGSSSEAANQLFMKEDEMASWLHHYQDAGAAGESQGGGGGSGGGGGGDLYSEMLEPSSRASSCSQVAEATGAAELRKEGSSSVVDLVVGKVFDAGSVKASVGCSSAHVSERKRKAETGKDIEYHSEDVEIDSGNKRIDVRQPTSTRTRAAEVHNLSERRRRDRINEKLRTLQELIPRCNKSDKASMLDDAIEYLKSLQLQVQMMSSMQYNMGQMMFPDTQRYMQTMGFMGMGMGMTSGGMQRPVMPFGPNLPYPPVFGQSSANLLPRLIPSFHQANVAIPDQVRLEASNQQDPASSSINMMGPNMVQIPNFADRYHHFAPFPHLQVSSQGQTMDEPGTSKKPDNNTKKPTGGND